MNASTNVNSRSTGRKSVASATFGVVLVVAGLYLAAPSTFEQDEPAPAPERTVQDPASPRFLDSGWGTLLKSGVGVRFDGGASGMVCRIDARERANELEPALPDHFINLGIEWSADEGETLEPTVMDRMQSFAVSFRPTAVAFDSIDERTWLVAGVDVFGQALVERWVVEPPAVVAVTDRAGEPISRRLSSAWIRTVSRLFHDTTGDLPPITCLTARYAIGERSFVTACTAEGNRIYELEVTPRQSSESRLLFGPERLGDAAEHSVEKYVSRWYTEKAAYAYVNRFEGLPSAEGVRIRLVPRYSGYRGGGSTSPPIISIDDVDGDGLFETVGFEH
jgi:hypothetical protein